MRKDEIATIKLKSRLDNGGGITYIVQQKFRILQQFTVRTLLYENDGVIYYKLVQLTKFPDGYPNCYRISKRGGQLNPILLVANPSSAMGRGRAVLERVVAWFAQNDVATHQLVSQHAGHLFAALPPLLKENWRAIAVLGGDGTLFEVVNICLDSTSGNFATPLAVIPGGTGNSFAKDLAGATPEDFLHKAVHGKPQPVDVARCRCGNGITVGRQWHKNEFYFINVLGTGFVAEVNHRSRGFKKLGMLGYAVSVFATLADLRPYQMRLVMDGKVMEQPNTFVAICNSRYIGGNMKIAPEANIRDNMLDVVVANSISRLELVRTFPKIFSGTHTSHPEVKIFRARSMRLETDPPSLLTPDGESLGTTPIEVEVLSGKLCMMT
jgi:diacylglycerol kinase (ATP)